MRETLSPTSSGPAGAITLAPLGEIVTIEALSGRDGTNRARGGNPQLTADTDQAAVLAWLAR